jgi:hypothetical protein
LVLSKSDLPSRAQTFEQSSYLICCVNTVQKVDVAQRGDELLFLYYKYTAAPPEEQTTESRIVPSHLLADYDGGLLGDCSKLLRVWNIAQSP